MITLSVLIKMDKLYDFSWIVSEIDNSLILKLVSGNKEIGVYQVSEIGYDVNSVEVKFANIEDLIKFINHSSVVFREVSDKKNIIRVPLRKLFLLFSNCNVLVDNSKRNINVNEIDAFVVCDGEMVNGNYQIQAYKVKEESDELKDIMEVAYKYSDLGMTDKIEALERVNLVNYHKTSSVKSA